MVTRRYSDKTIKLLFGASGNQCAFPECTNPIIATGTPDSDAAVVGQICHIYAAADKGPRGKPGLTDDARNAIENLILLCGHHHPLIDKQWETYPAETLKNWKRIHEAKYQQGTAESAKLQSSIQQLAFVQALSDEQITNEVERIRKGRLVTGFPTEDATLALAMRVDTTELTGGSSDTRARALAWCARLLSLGAATRAAELLEKSKALAVCDEAKIAEAFIISPKDRNKALAILGSINSPAARSAALRVVINHDQAKGALIWVRQSGLTADDFDADGKFALLMSKFVAEEWNDAIEMASNITEADFKDMPVLYYAAAMSSLFEAVPEELRASLLVQLPFEADRFPLASSEAALSSRRKAIALFSMMSDFVRSLGVAGAANPASDYALWLKLRDPRDHDGAIDDLRSSMRDPAESLRRVNLAIKFGVKLDLPSIEREIDRRIALSGGGTPDDAFARLALVFAQETPRAAAEYIARHREQLYAHLLKGVIQAFEIELLARGGLIGAAKDLLAKASGEELGERERQTVLTIIAECETADPLSERRKLYEQTGDLRDLLNLVNLLEEQGSWREAQPFAERLFTRTRSLEDASRLARALNESGQYEKLFEFLSSHPDVIAQSTYLNELWAWSLFRIGRFEDATNILKDLRASRDSPNDGALWVNIAIASGNWSELVDYSSWEWGHRADRTGRELLAAGQLGQAVGSPRAKQLITAATECSPNDPEVLAAAYFHAMNAGWEHDTRVRDWLTRAAALSGDTGPLRFISIKELFDRKPEWDKRETTAWQQLNDANIPIFGAAHLLNRSLIDFVLLPSLANLTEPDPRRRNIVYAFSGARPPIVPTTLSAIALDLVAIISLTRLQLLRTVIQTYKPITIPHSTLGWLFQERRNATFHQPSRIKDAHLVRRLVASSALRVMPSTPVSDHGLLAEVGAELAQLLLAAKSMTGSGSRLVVRSAPVHRLSSLMGEEADLSNYADCLCSCGSIITKLRNKGLLTSSEAQQAMSYLSLQERAWPNEPVIPDEAELYLDGLSVNYLNFVGATDKLKLAALTAYITDAENDNANRLIAFEALADRQLEIIESIRSALADGLKAGDISVARLPDNQENDPFRMHPTISVLSIYTGVDALVVDDRFVNRHLQMNFQGHQVPILSSLDLINDLARRHIISAEALCSHRTHLRQAGFQLVPIFEDELVNYLASATLENGAVVETAELRAIRESLLKARMSKMLQIPTEAPWLQNSMGSIIRAIKELWRKEDVQEAAACSDWLIELLDVRGWAVSAMPENRREFALFSQAAQILLLMSAPDGLSPEVRNAYHGWVDERVLKEIEDTQPEVFAWLVERERELVGHSVDAAVAKLQP